MIGIFDSGIGGLALYKAAKAEYPHKGFIYLADQANFPYGLKSRGEVISLAKKNSQELINYGAKVIMVACNTATVTAIEELRKSFEIPFIGIEPGVKTLSIEDINRSVVLATSGTLKRHRLLQNIGPEIIAADNLVKEIEENPDLTEAEVRREIGHLISPGTRNIVLGCTHYHLIKEQLRRMFPESELIVPESAVIKRLGQFAHLGDNGQDIYLTTGNNEIFMQKLAKVLMRRTHARKI